MGTSTVQREGQGIIHDLEHPRHKYSGLLVIAAAFALTLIVGLIAASFLNPQRPGTPDSNAFKLAGLNATLCSVGTEKASGYVGIYALYGTLTRTPTRTPQRTGVAALPTATITPSPYMLDSMATALAALPTSNATPTPTFAAYVSPTPKPPDAARGKLVFNGAGTCNACHDVSTGAKVVGPSLKRIASVAASREAGKTAQDYLWESIVSPNDYIVPGFAAGVMPISYDKTLDQQQIADIVAYLLTLK
jgi:cytochrome c2